MNERAEPQRARPNVEATLGVGKAAGAARRGKWFRRFIWLALIAGGVALYLRYSASGGAETVYETEEAALGDVVVFVTATGSLEPTNTVDISSELSGVVREVFVDFNSNVEAGQALARLDTDKLEASVESAEAQLQAAEASVRSAEATVVETQLDFERTTDLVARSIGSTQDLEIAKAAYDRAVAALESQKADVIAASAQLRVQQADLARGVIYSPIDGVVLSRDIDPGQTVASSLQAPTLFTIAEDLTKMEVQVDVDEADVGKVAEGQRATFTVDAYPDQQFAAEISQVRFISEVVSDVVTYTAVLRAPNEHLLLRPGMTATAEIVVEEVTGGLTVPNAALRFEPPREEAEEESPGFSLSFRPPRGLFRASDNPADDGERSVWILKDGVPTEIPVETGATDGQRTVITSGDLEPGQALIIDARTPRG